MPAIVVLAVAVFALLWGGCSNKENPVKPTSVELKLLTIICNPLAPAPGDTAELTTQPVGRGSNPTFQWQVSGGTLVSNGAISVRWVVPRQKGLYRVSVRAAIGSAVDTMSKYVMIRNIETINTGIKYTYAPKVTETDFLFIGIKALPPQNGYPGYHVYRLFPFEQITKNTSPTIDGGYFYTFVRDSVVLGSVITGGGQFFRQEPMNIVVFPLGSGGAKTFVTQENGGSIFRRNQNLYPSMTGDAKYFVWQNNKVGATEDGTKDYINLQFRAKSSPTITTLTISKDSTFKYGGWFYRFYHNTNPMFTPNGSNIVYFCDSTKAKEPCIIPMGASGPDLSQRHEIGGPGPHGILYRNSASVGDKTIYEWNPAIPTELGFVETKNRSLCLLDYAAETVDIIGDFGKINEFAWSDDGKVAAINNQGVVLVGIPGSVPDTAFVRERSGDDVIGVGWSPGTSNQKIAFRIVRKGVSAAETFAAIVVYSVDDHKWYYASPRIPAGSEPTVDYPWLRATFFGDDVYMPIPVQAGGGSVTVYHSY